MVTRIISGAQTGADRAGLDAALALGIETGGWIPLGRRTDEGPLSLDLMRLYHLHEHPSANYPPRTEQNVRESDGTVIFGNPYSPGCSLTARLCRTRHKPCLIMDAVAYDVAELVKWILNNGILTMNVAGNRERTNIGIYSLTFRTIVAALGTDTTGIVLPSPHDDHRWFQQVLRDL